MLFRQLAGLLRLGQKGFRLGQRALGGGICTLQPGALEPQLQALGVLLGQLLLHLGQLGLQKGFFAVIGGRFQLLPQCGLPLLQFRCGKLQVGQLVPVLGQGLFCGLIGLFGIRGSVLRVLQRLLSLLQGLQGVLIAVVGVLHALAGIAQGALLGQKGGVLPRFQPGQVPVIIVLSGNVSVISVGDSVFRADDGGVQAVFQIALELLIIVPGRGDGGAAHAGRVLHAGLLGLDLIQKVLVIQPAQKLALLHPVAHLHTDLLHGIRHGGIDRHAPGALHRAGGADAVLQVALHQPGRIRGTDGWDGVPAGGFSRQDHHQADRRGSCCRIGPFPLFSEENGVGFSFFSLFRKQRHMRTAPFTLRKLHNETILHPYARLKKWKISKITINFL